MHCNVLIPMAGAGTRFSSAGFTDYKALIPILGQSMIRRVLSPFLESSLTCDFKFVIREEHYEALSKELYALTPKIYTKTITNTTEGAACTALLHKNSIDNYKPLIIADCDAVYSPLALDLLNCFVQTNPDVDSVSMCFLNDSPKNSFIAIGMDGFTTKTAEKQVISPFCSTGLHWFKNGSIFVQAAEAMILANDRTNNEFYVTPSINHLIKLGFKHKPLLVPNQLYDQIGTPEDVLKYMNKLHAKISDC